MASVYLTKAEMKTNALPEVIDLIERGDDTIIEDAIDAAIGMARGYLSRYDLDKLFGVEADSTAPVVTDANLKRQVKNIAMFNFMSLANVMYNAELLNTLKEDAIRWLRDIEKGLVAPDWPYRDTSTVSYPDGQQVYASYNDKKTNRI